MFSFQCFARPSDVSHGYPFVVLDSCGELHLPLIAFAKDAQGRLAPSSVKKYLTGILPWFTWLETDLWQVRAGRKWNDPPEIVRNAAQEYLVSRLQCRVRPFRYGGEAVDADEEMISSVRILLAALKFFYHTARMHEYYPYTNPFVEPVTLCSQADTTSQDEGRLRMPAVSGVDQPPSNRRLTDSYFVLIKDVWIPQVVTDPELPQKVLAGGRALKGWSLRGECVVRLLFETGARVSEIMDLRLDDWSSRGLRTSAWARNKGSHKRRAKFIRFSEDTATLLRKYFDTERTAVDRQHVALGSYLQMAEHQQAVLADIPIFLSHRGTEWSVASFRAHYWKRACATAQMDVDIHQTRHWYVNQALGVIHERARKGEITVERGTEELIAYMHWRSGKEVLQAYNHFYDPAHHAATQDQIFKKLAEVPQSQKSRQLQNKHTPPSKDVHHISQEQRIEASPDGMELYAFLIGTGGYKGDFATID